ncbi:Flp pilus assembly protein CpaB [Acidisphaera rubrifaciens]|uniref:Pilus assembly protein n=1 Tax=Acidisphaera rubrifaciens HS-AP3 TaxID=1231350 RepID=A0A0D6P6J4_9PROT|nr:Flp pilus assembly protein CpaB [Acidisphaera rubrifaciens]GAN76966.1 pilus assembly protein [Acidisphaera rubrifaciens HS-AP3]
MAKADPVRIAVTLGFAATSMVAVVGFWQAFSGARAPSRPAISAGPPVATVPVQVAARPIARGETIGVTALRTLSVVDAGPSDGYRTTDALAGLVALTDILPGQIVLPAMVAADHGGAGLAALIPPGQRAVAISVTEDMAVSNLIRPGDLVDVLLILRAGVLPQAAGMPPVMPSAFAGMAAAHPAAPQGDPSETRLLLQAVRVLTTGTRLGGALTGPGGAPPVEGGATRTLTLCLTPSQAETIALARTLGTLALILRNPADDRRAALPPVTLSALRDGPAPAAADPVRAGPRPVELIVGQDHRLIYPLADTGSGAGPAARALR